MTKEFSVYFKIISRYIEKKNTIDIIYKTTLIVLVISVIIFFLSISLERLKSLYYSTLFISTILFIFFVIIYKKKYKINKIGTLTLTKNSIIIKIKDRKITFNIINISDLVLEYNGYKYGIEFGLPLGAFIKTGNENYIKFTYNNEKKTYQFQSENPNDYKYIQRILSAWKKKGINCEYIKT